MNGGQVPSDFGSLKIGGATVNHTITTGQIVGVPAGTFKVVRDSLGPTKGYYAEVFYEENSGLLIKSFGNLTSGTGRIITLAELASTNIAVPIGGGSGPSFNTELILVGLGGVVIIASATAIVLRRRRALVPRTAT